jgi:hypothetical protein
MTCTKTHNYTVEDEARQEVRYAGTDQDEAVNALVKLRSHDECGQVTAEHETDETTVMSLTQNPAYCFEESTRIEDEAIKAWDYMETQWQNAHEAFHGEGPYALANQDW